MKPAEISKSTQRAKYVVTDLLTGALAFWVFNIVRYYLLQEVHSGYYSLSSFLGSTKLIVEQCVVPFVMLVIYWISGYYNRPFQKSRLQEFNVTFFSSIITTVIIYLVLLINDQTGKRIINYEMIGILFLLLFLITYFPRLIITTLVISHFRKDKWHINVLIIGNSSVSRNVAKKLYEDNKVCKYNLRGFVEIPGEHSIKDSMPVFKFEDFEKICGNLEINQVILAPEYHDDKKVMMLLSILFPLDIPVKISPDTLSYVTSAIRMNDIYGEPFVDLTTPAISESSKNIKRLFDVSFSIFVLLVLSPLFAILALCVRFSSKGPVIYSQERIGRHQKPFSILKFRTMILNAEETGPQLSQDNDPRITRVGRWMRKYRFDELPQFWNVIKGDMSIVGPRPEREFYIRQIVQEAPYYTLVCQVRPGITSWGMVKYGYASSLSQMIDRTQYDLIYLANMSLSVDFKILIYTFKTIISGSGK
ncbi:MAG: sugar transferase [Muribaculaceae bacterium]|nr:sugar transferase [Muribaculaceae bacterium]